MKKWFLVVLCLGLVSCGGEGSNNSGVSKKEVEAGANQTRDWFRAEVEFATIKAGWFRMRNIKDDRVDLDVDETLKMRVRVDISKDFEMMATEMTQALYERVMKKNPSRFKREGDCNNWDSEKWMCPDNPVDSVSWDDTQKFIKTLNASLGLKGCEGRPGDPSGCYRLPTEAEWDYATRAGSSARYTYFFEEYGVLSQYAISKFNSGGRTHRVKGNRLSNRNGLYDVYGNVMEWVQDVWRDTLPGGKDPLVTTGSHERVFRGFGWNSHFPTVIISADRDSSSPDSRRSDIGFRLVRTL